MLSPPMSRRSSPASSAQRPHRALPGRRDHRRRSPQPAHHRRRPEAARRRAQAAEAHLWGAGITDAGLDALLPLTNLTELNCRTRAITDAGLAKLVGLTKLKSLNLQRVTEITNDGMAHLGKLPELTYLTLLYTRITDPGLEHWQNARSFACSTCVAARSPTTASRTRATDRPGRAEASAARTSPTPASPHLKSLKRLRGLALEDAKLTDAGMAHFAGLTELDDLDLMRVPISDEASSTIAGLTKLRILFLRGTLIGGDGLVHLKDMKQLRKLDLSETGANDAGMKYLAGMNELVWLNLWNTMVGNDGVAEVVKLPKIQYLNLDNTRIDDDALKLVAKMPELHAALLERNPGHRRRPGPPALVPQLLKKLELRQTEVTEEGVAALKKALPKLEIVIDLVAPPLASGLSPPSSRRFQQRLRFCTSAISLEVWTLPSPLFNRWRTSTTPLPPPLRRSNAPAHRTDPRHSAGY